MVWILRLLRVPGVFTALADILAGYLIIRLAGIGLQGTGPLPYLLGASACLYMAGMAWNDIFDFDEDSRLRPERPLPSGKVTMTGAVLLASTLSVAGVMLAMRASVASFLIAVLLLLMILLYNSIFKNIEGVGPLSMGGCRGLNLLLGMSVHPYIFLLLQDKLLLLPSILLTLYVAVITVLASLEHSRKPKAVTPPIRDRAIDMPTEMDSISDIDKAAAPSTLKNLPPDTRAVIGDQKREKDWNTVLQQNAMVPSDAQPLVDHDDDDPDTVATPTAPDAISAPDRLSLYFGMTALLALPLLTVWILPHQPLTLPIIGILFLLLLLASIRAFRTPTTSAIRRVVGISLGGICLFDAALVASFSTDAFSKTSIAAVCLIAALLIPATVLRRWIALT